MEEHGLPLFLTHQNCEKNDTSGSGLSALLAIPLKRINQYEFWLELMFEATPTTDSDYQRLEDALEAIAQLSETVLKSNVKAGEMAQVMDVQKRMTGFEESLVDQDRVLIKEAPLMMLQQVSIVAGFTSRNPRAKRERSFAITTVSCSMTFSCSPPRPKSQAGSLQVRD